MEWCSSWGCLKSEVSFLPHRIPQIIKIHPLRIPVNSRGQDSKAVEAGIGALQGAEVQGDGLIIQLDRQRAGVLRRILEAEAVRGPRRKA